MTQIGQGKGALRAGAEFGQTTQADGVTFLAYDWFPHVNRYGAVVVVLRWAAECLDCGASWEATSAASLKALPAPRVCECRK